MRGVHHQVHLLEAAEDVTAEGGLMRQVHGFLVQNIGIANAPDARNALTALIREVA